ncbi:MAG: cupin domain-containing protein [Chloroflexota bacterium]
MQTTHPTAIHVPPDSGQAFWLVGDTYTIKLSGEQTGGAFSLSEATVPPGGGPPPHIHNAEAETFVVLEGELLLEADGQTQQARTGAVLYVPMGTRHAFTNVGQGVARMLFLYTPAGMERMFAEIGTPTQPNAAAPPAGPEDVAKLISVAAKYQFEILPPASE